MSDHPAIDQLAGNGGSAEIYGAVYGRMDGEWRRPLDADEHRVLRDLAEHRAVDLWIQTLERSGRPVGSMAWFRRGNGMVVTHHQPPKGDVA